MNDLSQNVEVWIGRKNVYITIIIYIYSLMTSFVETYDYSLFCIINYAYGIM